MELAAKWGDPLFSANVTNPIEPYAELIAYYRERWAFHGHDPADAVVGAGYYASKTSQEAVDKYRPIFESRLATQTKLGLPPVFTTIEDLVDRGSALIGSPEQIIDKVSRYHERFGDEVLHISADRDGLTDREHRETLELFQTDIAAVLRKALSSRDLW